MAPKHNKPVYHNNGAVETVFAQNPKPKPAAKKKAPAGRSRKKGAALSDDAPSEGATDVPPPSDSDAPITERHDLRVPVTDERENPFLDLSGNPVDNTATPKAARSTNNVRFAAPLTPAQLSHLVTVAIPSTEAPRAGRHSPMQGSPTVAQTRQKKRHTAKDVNTFFEVKKGRKFCKFCTHQRKTSKEKLDHPDSYGTSTASGNLRRHLYTCHLDEWLQSCNKLGIKITATDTGLRDAIEDYNRRHGGSTEGDGKGSDGPVPTYRPYSPEAFTDAIVEWIVADDQSINVIENPHLRSIFLMLRKDLRDKDIPHRTLIRNHVLEMWEQHVKDLEEEFENAVGKISFTADCWTDSNLTPFMAITAHWIDVQYKKSSRGSQCTVTLRAELIGFHRVPGWHTGEHLAAVFLSVIDRLHIQRIGWITLDNASNNDTMMETLEALLSARGLSFSAVDRRIRCFPHIVNLAVQAILTAITDMDYAKDHADDFNPTWNVNRDLVATLRTLINQIRASSLRRDQFARVQESLYPDGTILQLIRDVSTRWSSTHLMISRALQLRRAIDVYIMKNKDLNRYKLSDSEWKVIEAYSTILSVPHAFQQKLSGEKTPTLCDALPSFQSMIAVWQRYQQEMPAYSEIIGAGIDKLTDYYRVVVGIPAFQLAILLNPTRRLRWFENNLFNEVNTARQLLINELAKYKEGGDSGSSTSTPVTETHNTNISTANDDDWAEDILGDGQNFRNSSPARSVEAEVNEYLLDVSPAGTVMLSFWQDNQRRYPLLFRLALDILAIQGSAVPCERVFSSGKETMTSRRNRTKSDLMEALQMLKFSLKRGTRLNFTAGTSRKDELNNLEEAALGDSFVPEDLTSFTDSLFSFLDEETSDESSDGSDSDSKSE